jgi:hypothetical protein
MTTVKEISSDINTKDVIGDTQELNMVQLMILFSLRS